MESLIEIIHKQIKSKSEQGLIGKYGTVSGYLSVTRLLKEMTDDTALQQWRASVGEKEADRITEAALSRGRRMHELIDQHFGDKWVEVDLTHPGDIHYNKILPELDNIEPLIVETCLFSDKLQMTGKTDTIGYYKGILSTIDYKTSKRPKRLEYMKSYGVQIALYSMMFLDMTGYPIRQGVLINSPDNEEGIDAPTLVQVFTFDVGQYVPLAMELIRRYRNGERKCINF